MKLISKNFKSLKDSTYYLHIHCMTITIIEESFFIFYWPYEFNNETIDYSYYSRYPNRSLETVKKISELRNHDLFDFIMIKKALQFWIRSLSSSVTGNCTNVPAKLLIALVTRSTVLEAVD